MKRFLRSINSVLFPPRLAILRELLLAFLALNALTRLALAAYNGEPSFFLPWNLLPAMAIGAVFDLAAATFVALPLAALLACWPQRYPVRSVFSSRSCFFPYARSWSSSAPPSWFSGTSSPRVSISSPSTT